MLNVIDAQDTELLEGPSTEELGELSVGRGDLLAATTGDLGVEPAVLEQLGRSEDGHARRVAGLEDGDETELLAGGKQIVGVDAIKLLLGVVAVGCDGGADEGGKELASTEGVSDSVGKGDDGVVAGEGEEGLQSSADRLGSLEDKDIVLLGGGNGIVVEVVDDKAGSLRGEKDVKLRQEGSD